MTQNEFEERLRRELEALRHLCHGAQGIVDGIDLLGDEADPILLRLRDGMAAVLQRFREDLMAAEAPASDSPSGPDRSPPAAAVEPRPE